MSSEDPLASVSEGVTKGGLSWTEEKLKELVTRFKNRDLVFVEDIKTIEIVKEQRKTSEWDIFKNYIDGPELRILFQMGLTLRKLEDEPALLTSLRDKILKKYDVKGLERTSTPKTLKFDIKNLLQNIEKTVVFIKQQDDVEKKTEEIVIKILANSPKTFIICSSKSAMGKCEKIAKKVMKRISDYTAELYKTEIKEIYFLNKSTMSLDG